MTLRVPGPTAGATQRAARGSRADGARCCSVPDVSWPNGFRQLDQESRACWSPATAQARADPGYGTGGRDRATGIRPRTTTADPASIRLRRAAQRVRRGAAWPDGNRARGLPAVPWPPTAPITAACLGITSLITADRPGLDLGGFQQGFSAPGITW